MMIIIIIIIMMIIMIIKKPVYICFNVRNKALVYRHYCVQ